ncbi:transposase [Stenotrophomonas sp. NPDC087984]
MRRGERPPWIVSDDSWARIEPLLPVVPRRTDHPGRKRLDDRRVLCGILFVLYTGIPWEFLPQELGFGSGMTCWRRLRDWNDVTQLIPLIEAVPPVRGRRGRPRRRPKALYADRGYDHDKYRKQVRAIGITPVIARRGTEHGSGLGVHRWVVEQSFALLHWFRRLRVRWEIRDDIHEAFLSLACGIICWRRLKNLSLC